MNFLLLYYLFVFIFVGIGGTLALIDPDILSQDMIRTVFMYQYAVYELAKDSINVVGIIILEILTTFSVWFLNVIVFVCICFYHVLSLPCKLFYFVFRKR